MSGLGVHLTAPPARARGLRRAVRVATRLVVVGLLWAPLRWLGRHWRWSAYGTSAVLVAAAVLSTGMVLRVALVILAPALVVGVWSTLSPGSYLRLASVPWRSWVTRRRARRVWPDVARASGLSVHLTLPPSEVALALWSVRAKPRQRWDDPRLRRVVTPPGVIVLRVQTRIGQSVEEVTTAAPRIRDSYTAASVRCVPHSPSVLDVVLVMVDPLAGIRYAVPTADPRTPSWRSAASEVLRHLLVGGPPVILGRGEDGTDVLVDVADPWHVAIQGATRSGKSALSYTLLGALAHRADVLVCGVDPSGILLGPWLHGRGAGWIATGTADMQGAVDALAGVVAEMDQRIAYLARTGLDVLSTPDATCPLLLVVLEEYPGALSAARSQDEAEGRPVGQRTAPRIERAVGRLVKEGAKVGVRVVLLAQRMSARAVDTDDRSNFGVRVSLRVDNGDALAMLHDGPTAREHVEAVRRFAPGVGLVEGPDRPLMRWRADLTEYADYRSRVAFGIDVTENIPGALVARYAPAPDVNSSGDDTSSVPPRPAGPSGRPPRSPRAPRAPRAPRDGSSPGLVPERAPGRDGGA